jgi:hypothetical protein
VISAHFLETHPEISPTGIGRFAGISDRSARAELLIAMQKVVGSNPISRFAKGLYLQAFLISEVALFVCVRSD